MRARARVVATHLRSKIFLVLVGPEHEHKNPKNLEATFFRDIL